ncbi:CHASE2 domain-containing protein [Reichenbachiella carrageenanivorans]|uniref:CHASE2 domain-containing protein n=1 Tax=Reichenbachiella carrageenanivorans TaxID=2979869 RepID=A0ABY6D0P0_9BACT|nr:CHASE2 domain-containing protein [Reichenbachiella carrageenanivorans]UXX79722.1 CHASE2 domain-containing protein [Reichenbachiella carrageenanivorans]
MTKKKLFLWLGIIVHALVMIFLTFYLMSLPWLAGDEKLLIWSTSALKFANREIPPSEKYALINTSYDLQLIDRLDDFGFPIGQRVITDREKLTWLLDIISQSQTPPKYIILDVHFLDTTDFDSALDSVLQRFDQLIISYHLGDDGYLEYPVFQNTNKGLSDYVIGSVFDGVYKYQLIHHDSLKLTPLKVHEQLSGKSATQWGPWVKIGEQWTPNNFIMNYRLLQKDIEDIEIGFNPVSMGELLFLENQDIQDYVAGKIVVIGDFFENDMHETLFEITAGPLILLNALLTIQAGDTYINFWFFALLFAAYTYLSYMVFVEGDYMEKMITRHFGTVKIADYLAGFMSYLLLLTLLSCLTFFVFNIHLNVFFLAIAFYLMDKVVGFIYTQVKN